MARYQSRLPMIAAELDVRTNEVLAEAAQEVVAKAKERVPVNTGRLQSQIHVEHREDLGAYEVQAGDASESDFAFYGHIVEHGSVNTGAHPFLVPAAEEVRAALAALGHEVFKAL